MKRIVYLALFALALMAYSNANAQQLWVNGKWYEMSRSYKFVVIDTAYHMSIDDVQALLEDAGVADSVEEFLPAAHYDKVMITFKDADRGREAVEKLRHMDEVERVSLAPLMFGNAPMMPTGEILVKLPAGTNFSDVEKRLARYYLEPVEECPFIENSFLMRLTRPELDPIDVATNLMKNEKNILWAEPNFIKKMVLRFRPNDVFYNRQWHLHNTGEWFGYTNGTPGSDVHAEQAWDITKGSSSVIIAIVDDGLQADHPDLQPNIIWSKSKDFLDDDNDPTPTCSSTQQGPYGHGISCAGVAAGKGNNSIGITGLCMNCSIMGIRLIGGYGVSDYTVASAFRYACDNGAAVINNSWGYQDPVAMTSYIKGGIDYCTTYGRGGLGSVFVWAAGNENRNIWSYEMECYDSVICVGATDQNDVRSSYSNHGACLDVVAPSSGSNDGSGWAITTTDYTGGCGYNQNGTYWAYSSMPELDRAGNYTAYFGGTSSAAPLVSGLVGLVLSANASLTWSQVIDLVRNTADDVGGDEQHYGSGRVNAYRAVLQAQQGMGCGDITWEGKCTGSTAMWCDNNTIITDDCASKQEDCGQNSNGLYRCLVCEPTPKSCRDGIDNDCDRQTDEADECTTGECYFPDFHGECNGTILTTCNQDNELGTVDCASLGMVCGYEPRINGNNCIQPPEECEPTANSCRDGKDNDCDNQTDEEDECSGNECWPSSFQKRCEGNNLISCNADKLIEVVNCEDYQMICGDSNIGKACIPEQCTPSTPDCTDGKDNDCDGQTDESDECPAASCDPLTFSTYCDGNVMVMCTNDQITRIDCGVQGKVCAVDNSGLVACGEPPQGCTPTPIDCTDGVDNDCDNQIDEVDECTDSCGGVTSAGTCVGSIAIYCAGGMVQQVDCSSMDKVCKQDPNGNSRCMEPPKNGVSTNDSSCATGAAPTFLLLAGLLAWLRRKNSL